MNGHRGRLRFEAASFSYCHYNSKLSHIISSSNHQIIKSSANSFTFDPAPPFDRAIVIMKSNLKFSIVLFFLLAANGILFAQPVEYYQTVWGLNGTELKTGLHEVIKDHNAQNWPLWVNFPITDAKADGKVWDIYSDIPGAAPAYVFEFVQDQCGNYSKEADCYNHEHTWPSTFFNDADPMRTDLFHVLPTDGYVNNKRSNLPYGVVSTLQYTSANGSKVGLSNSFPGYTDKVFEPLDSFKGDLARIYFYMSTRYEGEDGSWKDWTMATGAELAPAAVQLLLSWHHLDPTSQKEIDRNNAVYTIQDNRNPFVDYPEFADCIWGNSSCIGLNTNNTYAGNEFTIFPNPLTDNILRIRNNTNSIPIQIQIIDINGRILEQLPADQQVFDVSDLPQGMYYIQILQKEGVYSAPFVYL